MDRCTELLLLPSHVSLVVEPTLTELGRVVKAMRPSATAERIAAQRASVFVNCMLVGSSEVGRIEMD